MPDILIRGMDVPESCEECVTKHTFFRELKCADLPGMRNFGENRLYTDSRNPHCPINKLPPHGDLISRDDLLHTMRCHLALYDSCPEDLSLADKSRRDEIQNAIADIFNAPVVVPAERREG